MRQNNKLVTWQIYLRDVMRDETEPVNCERIIHQSGSCFVWNWRPKRNQNIIIFPKTCVHKIRTTRYKSKNIYRLLKNYAGIHPKHPQTIGEATGGGKDMEEWRIQGPSPQWALQTIDLSQLCTRDLPITPVMIMIWQNVQKSLQMSDGWMASRIWLPHVTLVDLRGLRSLVP